jgi:hypothetical protein
VVHVKYEALRTNTRETLLGILARVPWWSGDTRGLDEIIARYEFSGQRTGGKTPPGGGFVREGAMGGWRRHFNEESRQLFNAYAGRQLITLGYERDHQWVAE